MQKNVRQWSVCLVTAALFMVTPGIAQAHLGSGGNCAGCHTTTRPNAVDVIKYDSTTAVSGRLDGGTSGALPTYNVAPGGIVNLAFNATDGSDALYGVALTGMEKGGIKNSQSNQLAFTADPAWTLRTKIPNYYTTPVSPATWNGPQEYDFRMAIGANTPLDIYSLTVKLTGVDSTGDMWTGSREFYVNVAKASVPEPTSIAAILGMGVTGLVWYGWRRRKR